MKKLSTAALAFAALAGFTMAPPVATATNDPEITHPTGTLLKTGTLIQGTAYLNTIMTNGSGEVLVECARATVTGTLTKNDGSNVEASITGAAFSGLGEGGKCVSSFGDTTVTANPGVNGLPWCLRSTSTMATDEFQIRGNSCDKLARSIRFILDTAVGECVYQRTTAILGTYETHPQDAYLFIFQVEFPLISGGFLCPSKGFFDMSFTLETDGSDDELYIS